MALQPGASSLSHERPEGEQYRFGFVMEYTIGHITFAKMLQRVVAQDPSIQASWLLVRPPPNLLFASKYCPPLNNYTLRMSWEGRRLVGRGRQFDALLLHSQTLSLFFPLLMRRVPTVISTDATPINIDEVSLGYQHKVRSQQAEAVKRRIIGTLLRQATYTMPWSHWAERSMVHDYGVLPERCRVVRPGVDPGHWAVASHSGKGPPRALFVGGDFERKGGKDLLAALSMANTSWECDVVTKSEVPTTKLGERVRVHNNLEQGDSKLVSLYAEADVFVMPTKGDALPWAILEAMAAGLPVVTTPVGSVPEVVTDGETGLLVAPGDIAGIARAMDRLATSADDRRLMGRRARQRVEEDYNEKVNGPAILTLLKNAVGGARGPGCLAARR